MPVMFYVSRGKKSNEEHIQMVKDMLDKNNKTFAEVGIKSKLSILKDFKEKDIDCLLIYDVEKYNSILQKLIIKTLSKALKYKRVYIFIEVLESGYDFTYSPLYNAYS